MAHKQHVQQAQAHKAAHGHHGAHGALRNGERGLTFRPVAIPALAAALHCVSKSRAESAATHDARAHKHVARTLASRRDDADDGVALRSAD